MKVGLGVLAVFFLSATTAEIVYLEDLNNDHDKRHLSFGLPENLEFLLKHQEGEVSLSLRRNKRLNANAPIYHSEKDEQGNSRIVRNRNIQPNYRVGYYQDSRNRAYIRAECKKQVGRPCARMLTGNVAVDGKEYSLEPATDKVNKRELPSHKGTPHIMEPLTSKARHDRRTMFETLDKIKTTETHADEKMDNRDVPDPVNSQDHGTRRKRESGRADESITDRHLRRKRAIEVHGIEVLLVLDHEVFNEFAKRFYGINNIESEMRKYYAHIMNGVDLLYASIQDDTLAIYVTISGYYISIDSWDSPWLDYNNNPVDGSAGLHEMVNWRKSFGLPPHDHAALITGTDIYNKWNRDIVGIAFPRGICNDTRVSITEETGFYVGATTIAHEIAHNLGAEHDTGIMGSLCAPQKEYIMSPSVGAALPNSTNIEPWRFSSCSIDSFYATFLLLAGNDCTLNRAVIYDEDEYIKHTEAMPGQLYSPIEQCELQRGDGAALCLNNENTSDICRNLQCNRPMIENTCYRYVAAHGTPCGGNKVCFEGICQETSICSTRLFSSKDIAKFHTSVTQSSDYQQDHRPAAFAVDGSITEISSTDTEMHPWWEIQFSNAKSIWKLKLWNRKDCCDSSMSDLNMTVDGKLCGLVSGPVALGGCHEIFCTGGPMLGTSVKIQKTSQVPTMLSFAEIQIIAGCRAPLEVAHTIRSPIKPIYSNDDTISFECSECFIHTSGDLFMKCTPEGSWQGTPPVCIAQRRIQRSNLPYKKVSQSSENPGHHPATLAIDDNSNTNSLTNVEDQPWWKVEFCETMWIFSVVMSSYGDCCVKQIRGVTISTDGVDCGHFSGPFPSGTLEAKCKEMNNVERPAVGKWVKIRRWDPHVTLGLAEVEINTVCLPPADVEHTNIYRAGKDYYAAGDELIYECDKCSVYTSGNFSRTCLPGSTWTNKPPVCTEKENLDLKKDYKTVSQSSDFSYDYPAIYALDDNTNTLASTTEESNPWWKLEFCKKVTVAIVRIRGRTDPGGHGVFGPVDVSVDGHLCGSTVEDLAPGTSVDVRCHHMILANSVEIKRPGQSVTLALAEVEVIVGCIDPGRVTNSYVNGLKNVWVTGEYVWVYCASCYYIQGDSIRHCTAAGTWTGTQPVCIKKEIHDVTKDFQNVYQSSEASNYTFYTSVLAIDGDLNTVSLTGEQSHPYWVINFCAPVTVWLVKIWNRNDCCPSDLTHLDIFVGNQLCDHFAGSIALGGSTEVTCWPSPLTGSKLKIEKTEAKGVLVLAEVEVIAACLAPTPAENATYSPIKPYYRAGDQITYKCPTCYAIEGSAVRNCSVTGAWTGTSPVCKEITSVSKPGPGLDYMSYVKSVSQSTTNVNNRSASHAIDGLMDTYSATAKQNDPWWRVDFCVPVEVTGVRLFNRIYCCENQLADLTIMNEYEVCGFMFDSVPLGGQVEVTCDKTPPASFVKILKLQDNKVLTLTEVEVY